MNDKHDRVIAMIAGGAFGIALALLIGAAVGQRAAGNGGMRTDTGSSTTGYGGTTTSTGYGAGYGLYFGSDTSSHGFVEDSSSDLHLLGPDGSTDVAFGEDGSVTFASGVSATTGAFTGDLTLSGDVAQTTTLSAATGTEYAYKLDYTTNKAAGDDYGLRINMTDTASPGESYPLWVGVGGAYKLRVNNSGTTLAAGSITSGGFLTTGSASGILLGAAGITSRSTNGDLVLNPDGTGDIILDTGGGPVQIGDRTFSWDHAPTGLGVEGSAEIQGSLYVRDDIMIDFPLEMGEDSGVAALVDKSVTAGSSTEESITIKIDAVEYVTLYADGDGAGGITNKKIQAQQPVYFVLASTDPCASAGYGPGAIFRNSAYQPCYCDASTDARRMDADTDCY